VSLSSTSSTIKANQILHAKIATHYESDEPHFRRENKEKVRRRLSQIVARLRNCVTMVDLGCGTGFLEELAPESISRIIGVDTTPEMLKLLKDKNLARVETLLASAENTCLPDSFSDLITGYTVLDHFEDPLAVFKEASRVLRSGGIVYFDLIPNASFWNALRSLSVERLQADEIVLREVREVNSHSEKMQSQYGIPAEVLAAAEPHKEIAEGFEIARLTDNLVQAGFSQIEIHREWFLGEARVFHSFGTEYTDVVAQHLSRLSPLTDHLFKYLWLTAVKT